MTAPKEAGAAERSVCGERYPWSPRWCILPAGHGGIHRDTEIAKITKRTRLSWRREPENSSEYGQICCSERGFALRGAGVTVARVQRHTRVGGFFWFTGRCDLWEWDHRNTAHEGIYFESEKAAKSDCRAWIKAQLAKEPRR